MYKINGVILKLVCEFIKYLLLCYFMNFFKFYWCSFVIGNGFVNFGIKRFFFFYL